MTIQIRLQPEAEARYTAEAREHGLPLERYLEDKLNSDIVPIPWPPRKQTPEEFKASLDSLAQYSDKIPDFSMKSFSRAVIYEDHD